jgi:hypothetical protein
MEENKGFFSRHKFAITVLGLVIVPPILMKRLFFKFNQYSTLIKTEPCRYYYQENQINPVGIYQTQKNFADYIKSSPAYDQIKQHLKSETEFHWANFVYDPFWEIHNRMCIGFTLNRELMSNKELQYSLGQNVKLKHKDLPATTALSLEYPYIPTKLAGLIIRYILLVQLYRDLYFKNQELYAKLKTEWRYMELMTTKGYEIRLITENEDSFNMTTLPEKRAYKEGVIPFVKVFETYFEADILRKNKK